MGAVERDIEAAYRHYIDACNQRDFHRLEEFVAEDVMGVRAGLTGYTAALQELTAAFPDLTWSIEDLVISQQSLAARLTTSGTHVAHFEQYAGTGRHLTVQELAIYRFRGTKIVRCWGDLEAMLRDALTLQPATRPHSRTLGS